MLNEYLKRKEEEFDKQFYSKNQAAFCQEHNAHASIAELKSFLRQAITEAVREAFKEMLTFDETEINNDFWPTKNARSIILAKQEEYLAKI